MRGSIEGCWDMKKRKENLKYTTPFTNELQNSIKKRLK
jgi:hypothetical protein